MQIFKKEKQVVELALKHADMTGESLQIMIDALKAFAGNDLQQLEASASRVHRLESEADEVLREVRELLYSGAYLPTIRGDIYHLLSAVDGITNRVEGCLSFVNCQKPDAVHSFQPEIAAILELTGSCYAELRKALRAFFKPKGKVEELRQHSRGVSESESSIDDMERALTLKIFESGLSIGEKLHLAQLLTRITRISDKIENTADELQLLSLKSIV